MITSDSAVVNPAVVKADRAWKRATSGDIPVAISAPVASLVTISDSRATTRNVAMAIKGGPPRVRPEALCQVVSGQARRSMTVAFACPPPSHMVWKP